MNPALKAIIDLHNHPELAKRPGMVYQVWQDGEVTLQKSGELLWQRSLHMIDAGVPSKAVSPDHFPAENLDSRGNTFIFTDRKGAYTVRLMLLGYTRYEGESEETKQRNLSDVE